uniref:SnoaL-like domain-containing protein n=1 Tax=Mucochytrium quahogii TaxID=96639 RepID=A0A7S2SCI4_9STRA|mmetsp:Transcript_2723/g.4147  ORF Transcript_2723/g.4147 Transcript_2723/m.4147 type:complete len:198 (-) Transcript_2723:514-1107(-)|eukprot:CAMPEP_0203774468 /NCGR_PEP_ID=MMETSP0099_2-20121227/5364_1 /ASSEMBLY_ACC=CAM_ASM_000209 /TAXON_ID=96639 /ORGANISM=" , Strain NY0313808BC1" /LENGTH=197 /DNA_ID=CAMNT_0050672681 /DNA_START=148 /DNA_END=741 /DNA_ORIENTATION=-
MARLSTLVVVLAGFVVSSKASEYPQSASITHKVAPVRGCKAAENCLQTRNVPTRTQRAVDGVLEEWEQGVSIENNATMVTSLFCRKALLWGTVSEHIRTDHASIRSYFDFFATEGNHIEESCGFMSITGINAVTYERSVKWTLKAYDHPVCARMTFVVVRERGAWCIKSLHSSTFPEEPEELQEIDEENHISFPRPY